MLIFSFVLALAGAVPALDYPTKPVQIIVPYPPGGTNDITARILEPKLASLLGRSPDFWEAMSVCPSSPWERSAPT